MRKLSVNIDHIATLRQARQESVPDPVQAAVLAELGGADGITVHLRSDRRHINERDLELLRKTIKTELNLEMAATKEMLSIALKIKPEIVTLVPERPNELTTQGGLDIAKHFNEIKPIAAQIKQADIKLSVFIDTDAIQVKFAKKLKADQIEINTSQYSKDIKNRRKNVASIKSTAELAQKQGMHVHCGHSIDYLNIEPILEIPQINGFSIGFSIVARSVLTGLKEAVADIKKIINRYTEEK